MYACRRYLILQHYYKWILGDTHLLVMRTTASAWSGSLSKCGKCNFAQDSIALIRSVLDELESYPNWLRQKSKNVWLTGWLADWLTGWLADWLTGWLADWLTGWLADWLTGWLADWLTGWLADWLTGWLADWLTSWLTDPLTERLTDWLNKWMKDFIPHLSSEPVEQSPGWS